MLIKRKSPDVFGTSERPTGASLARSHPSAEELNYSREVSDLAEDVVPGTC